MMARGETVRAGDFIPYIVTEVLVFSSGCVRFHGGILCTFPRWIYVWVSAVVFYVCGH